MMNLLVLASMVLGLLAVGLLVAEAWTGYTRRVDRRINQVRLAEGNDSAPKSKLFRDLSFVESGKHQAVRALRRFVEQSALPITFEQLVLISVMTGMAIWLPFAAWKARPAILAVSFLIGCVLPIGVVAIVRRRRINRMRALLPEVFDSMGRAVQSGQSIPAALQLVAAEGRQPLAREFERAVEQHNLGLSFEQTLQDLCDRVPVIELRILSIALIVQRQTGGNPLEIIANMSDLIRKRQAFQLKIKALTGEGRMQAIVLTTLPVIAFAGLMIARRDYIQCLLDRPRLLQGLVAAQVTAALWIRRIVRLPY